MNCSVKYCNRRNFRTCKNSYCRLVLANFHTQEDFCFLDFFRLLCAIVVLATYEEISDASCENREKNEHKRRRDENHDVGERTCREESKQMTRSFWPSRTTDQK